MRQLAQHIALGIALAAAIAAPQTAAAQEPALQPAAPQPITRPALSLEQRTALRCAASFALIANKQDQGDASALKYPRLETRGREYFVRSAAQVMEQTKMSREQVAVIIQNEAQEIVKRDKIDELMPACLLLLDSSGL